MVSLLIALQIWCLSKVRTRPAGRKVILGIFFGLTTEYRATFPTILIEVARWLGSRFQGIIQMARWLVSRNGSLARQSIPRYIIQMARWLGSRFPRYIIQMARWLGSRFPRYIIQMAR